MTLRFRLLLTSASAILPLLGMIAVNEFTIRTERQAEIRGQALETARSAALELDRVKTGVASVLQSVAAAPAVRLLNTDLCTIYLKTVVHGLPHFSGMAVYDLRGDTRCRSDTLHSELNYADQPYFKGALQEAGALWIGEYNVGRVTGRASLPVAMAVKDFNGNITGVVAGGIDLSWLGALISERLRDPQDSITVADRRGTIIARVPEPERFVGSTIPKTFSHLLTEREPGALELTSQDGMRRMLGYIPAASPPEGLYVSAGVGVERAYAALDQASFRSVAMAVLAAGLGAFLAWQLADKLIFKPLHKVSSTLRERQRGDYGARSQLGVAYGELGELGGQIDTFLDQLDQKSAEKERLDKERELLFRELSHRIKNMVATIQALASQTFVENGDRIEQLSAFKERLGSVGRAQELLTTTQTASALLRQAIESSTGIFESKPGARFQLKGPDLAIEGRAVLAVTTCIHELCTNAAKYGALSNETGTVEVEWSVAAETVVLTWQEHNGPPVEKPDREGFGTRLIRGMVHGNLSGKASFEYPATGFICRMVLPLARIILQP